MEPNTKNYIDSILRNCAEMNAGEAATWAIENIPDFLYLCEIQNIAPDNFIYVLRELSS